MRFSFCYFCSHTSLIIGYALFQFSRWRASHYPCGGLGPATFGPSAPQQFFTSYSTMATAPFSLLPYLSLHVSPRCSALLSSVQLEFWQTLPLSLIGLFAPTPRRPVLFLGLALGSPRCSLTAHHPRRVRNAIRDFVSPFSPLAPCVSIPTIMSASALNSSWPRSTCLTTRRRAAALVFSRLALPMPEPPASRPRAHLAGG